MEMVIIDKKSKTYKIPIYQNGIQTEWFVEGIEGDVKWKELLKMGNNKEIPSIININTKKQYG